MHEGMKWYACEQTTRSLWITVPTSEPFISSLACNQADLVCTDWWFRTKDWTLRDVNLLRKKTLSQEGSQKRGRARNTAKKQTNNDKKNKQTNRHYSGCSWVHIFRPDLSESEQKRTESKQGGGRWGWGSILGRSAQRYTHRALMTHQILKKMSAGAMNSYFSQTSSKTVPANEWIFHFRK